MTGTYPGGSPVPEPSPGAAVRVHVTHHAYERFCLRFKPTATFDEVAERCRYAVAQGVIVRDLGDGGYLVSKSLEHPWAAVARVSGRDVFITTIVYRTNRRGDRIKHLMRLWRGAL